MSTTQRMATTRRFPEGARRALLAGAAVLIGSLAAGCGSDTDAQDIGDRAAIQAKMDRLVSLGVPGVTVLVRDADKSLQLTAGVSDLETRTAVDPDDRFRIGSLAKPYVATVVMQLAEEGRLDLGDTVERWKPGTVPNGRTSRCASCSTTPAASVTTPRSARRSTRHTSRATSGTSGRHVSS